MISVYFDRATDEDGAIDLRYMRSAEYRALVSRAQRFCVARFLCFRLVGQLMTSLMIFVSCMPRLEVLLEREVVKILGARKIARKHGGVELRVSHQELWKLSHDLRIAATIRVRVGQAHTPHFDALEEAMHRLPWAAYLPRTALPNVQVRCRTSALYHDDAVAERVEEFFWQRSVRAAEQAGVRHTVPKAADEESSGVYVRIVNDVATFSVDAAEQLYRRGLRSRVHRAPLRETYAAACLRATGLDASMALADPVCGSGVFLSERASIDGGFRLPRGFAFEQWPTHSKASYQTWCALRPPLAWPQGLRLWGGDSHADAMEMTEQNMRRWQAKEALQLHRMDVRDFLAQLSPDIDVIANPPWGKRLGGADAVGAAFGHWLRARPKDATGQVVVLVTGHEFLRATGVRWREVLRFRDASTPVRLMRYEP